MHTAHEISRIVSLAIVKANWDAKGADLLDTYLPFLAECIFLHGESPLTQGQLQADLKHHFGLEVPQNAIKVLLNRLQQTNRVSVKHKLYSGNQQVLEEDHNKFVERRDRFLDRYDVIIKRFIEFTRIRFEHDYTIEEAEKAFDTYLTNDLLVINSLPDWRRLVRAENGIKPETNDFYVASFLEHVEKTDPVFSQYWEQVAVGNMLANAAHLPEPFKPEHGYHRLNNVEIFFDTPFLMHALGYAGNFRQQPCDELLTLLRLSGAKLYCFSHTLNEIRAVLFSHADRIRRNVGYAHETLDHFRSSGFTPSDIELRAAELEDQLNDIGIKVTLKPDYRDHRTVIDETAFEERLENAIGYKRVHALKHDVDCVSAIMRIRRGTTTNHLDRCIALFLTPNTALARVSSELVDVDKRIIPPCLTDFTMTNLLWLALPNKAPDLPRKLLIADRIAALQPSEQLITRIQERVESMLAQGELTKDDRTLLLYSQLAKEKIMEVTHGDDEAVTNISVQETVDLIRLAMREEDRKRIDELSSENTIVTTELQAAQYALAKHAQDKTDQRNRIRAEATLWSQRRIGWIRITILVISVATIFGGVLVVSGLTGILISLVGILLGSLDARDRAYGNSWIGERLYRLERHLADKREEFLLQYVT